MTVPSPAGDPVDMIYLGTVSYPDDGIRVDAEGNLWYHPHLDVNGVHAALLDPYSNYGKPAVQDLPNADR